MNDVPAEATAYAHRHQNFDISAVGYGPVADRLDAAWPAFRPHWDGLYHNFETGTGPDDLAQAFPGKTLARLQQIKRQYDPENVFGGAFAVQSSAG